MKVILLVALLLGLALTSCAAAPPADMCTICRFVNARGEVWFTEYYVPVGTPLEGWEVIWPRYSYQQQGS
jgi:hypothetical protein